MIRSRQILYDGWWYAAETQHRLAEGIDTEISGVHLLTSSSNTTERGDK